MSATTEGYIENQFRMLLHWFIRSKGLSRDFVIPSKRLQIGADFAQKAGRLGRLQAGISRTVERKRALIVESLSGLALLQRVERVPCTRR